MLEHNDPLVAMLGLDPDLVEQTNAIETSDDDPRHAALMDSGPIGRAARKRVIAAEKELSDK